MTGPTFAILVLATVFLAACKAEKVEIRLDARDVVAAAAGQPVQVAFEAQVGERFATVDDAKRQTIEAAKALIGKYFPDAEVEVSIGADEYSFEIEGRVALSSETPRDGAPWYVSATPDTDTSAIRVSLLPSGTHDSFRTDLQAIDLMIGPDWFQPLEFSFSADQGMVVVGKAYVDGNAETLSAIPMTGDSVVMQFERGVWADTGGGFLYFPDWP